MSDHAERFSKGGYISGDGVKVRIEQVGVCPHGHRQYRINGSRWVEHIATARDPEQIWCPHAVVSADVIER